MSALLASVNAWHISVLMVSVTAPALLCQSRAPAQTDDKAIVEYELYWDTAPPPPTLVELFRESEAVFVGHYRGKRRVVEGSPLPGQLRPTTPLRSEIRSRRLHSYGRAQPR